MQQLQSSVLKILFVLIWFLALAEMTAEYYYLYWLIKWFDILMHFLGGVWVGIASIWLWHFSGYLREKSLPTMRTLLVVLLSGIGIGIIWELYEYGVWNITGAPLPPNYIGDTALDLVMDTVGAVFSFVALKYFLFDPHVKTQKI